MGRYHRWGEGVLSLFNTEANLIYLNKGSVKYSYIYKRPEAIFTTYAVNQFNSKLKAIISKDSESLTFYVMPEDQVIGTMHRTK